MQPVQTDLCARLFMFLLSFGVPESHTALQTISEFLGLVTVGFLDSYTICLRVLTHLHMSFASPAFLLPLSQVYPVDGGMEDWSYAAGWEQSPEPISVCRPTTYGGYAEDRR